MSNAAIAQADPAAIAPDSPAAGARDSGADRKARNRAAMLSGPIVPSLLRMALPTIGVMVAQTMVNTAEAYYLGFLGTDALAGAAMVFPIFMLMMTMSNGGLGSGVASSVARAVGAGRQHDADALVFHAIVLAALMGALFTAGVTLGGPALYTAMGGRDGSLSAALIYSGTLFAGSIPAWIVNFLACAMRGVGNVRAPALVTLIGGAVTVVASPALIFGFGPIPRLGLSGAGLSFGLYYTGATLVLLRYMSSSRSELRLRIVPLQRRLFADILKVGLPTAINTVQTNLCVILVTAVVGAFGVKALAGYGIAARLDYVLIPILFGLASSVLTMVGVNVGAGNAARARHITWVSGLIGVGITETIGIVAAVAPMLWLRLFSTDLEVLATGATYLGIVGGAYGLYGFGFVSSFAGQGAGRVLWPTVAVSARLTVAAGGSWLAVHGWGGGMVSLAVMVAGSFVAYAAIAGLVVLSLRPRRRH